MLVPVIDGAGLPSPVIVAVADPLAWTRAPLFIAQAEAPPRAEVRHDDGDPAAASSQRRERDFAPADPQTGGLFVVDRKSGGWGKSLSVRVDLGVCRNLRKTKE